MMDRRSFLRALLAAPLAIHEATEIDWDRLLWVPKPIITVPDLTSSLKTIWPQKIMDECFKDSPFMAYLRERVPDEMKHSGAPIVGGSYVPTIHLAETLRTLARNGPRA
jgi:hypothetical protein